MTCCYTSSASLTLTIWYPARILHRCSEANSAPRKLAIRWPRQKQNARCPAAFSLFLITFFSLVCCPSNAQQYPKNYIFLGLFTLAEGFMLGVNASRFQTADVMLAMGITFALVAGLTAFACTTRRDFTGAGPYLFVALFSFVLFGLFAVLFRSRMMSVVYCSLGVMLFGFYIVYDTQLILGGDHKRKFGVDDYVFAALNLYLDIINLFLYVLSLVSNGNRR